MWWIMLVARLSMDDVMWWTLPVAHAMAHTTAIMARLLACGMVILLCLPCLTLRLPSFAISCAKCTPSCAFSCAKTLPHYGIVQFLQLPVYTQWFATVHNPRWTMKDTCPVTWMLLSWVMLTSQFVGVCAGTHWHSVMSLRYHRHLLDIAEQ